MTKQTLRVTRLRVMLKTPDSEPFTLYDLPENALGAKLLSAFFEGANVPNVFDQLGVREDATLHVLVDVDDAPTGALRE